MIIRYINLLIFNYSEVIKWPQQLLPLIIWNQAGITSSSAKYRKHYNIIKVAYKTQKSANL
jgi:hypothetical protein